MEGVWQVLTPAGLVRSTCAGWAIIAQLGRCGAPSQRLDSTTTNRNKMLISIVSSLKHWSHDPRSSYCWGPSSCDTETPEIRHGATTGTPVHTCVDSLRNKIVRQQPKLLSFLSNFDFATQLHVSISQVYKHSWILKRKLRLKECEVRRWWKALVHRTWREWTRLSYKTERGSLHCDAFTVRRCMDRPRHQDNVIWNRVVPEKVNFPSRVLTSLLCCTMFATFCIPWKFSALSEPNVSSSSPTSKPCKENVPSYSKSQPNLSEKVSWSLSWHWISAKANLMSESVSEFIRTCFLGSPFAFW